ncbi:MAG: translocation/assembly module TamB domain-containing protein [Cellvibrionaceae bacterium]
MMRRLPRWARWMLALLLVLLALYLLVLVLLTSTAFSRFVLNRVEAVVPELAFSDVSGSFTEGLHFNFEYSIPGTQVQVDQADLALGLGCVWQSTVCIDRLHLTRLHIILTEITEEEPSDAEATALPEIVLPVNIVVDSLVVGSLLVRQNDAQQGDTPIYQLDDLQASLAWSGSTLTVAELRGSDPYCRWSAVSEITFINQYPVNARLDCESVAGYGDAAVDFSGDLQQLNVALEARAVSEYTVDPAEVQAFVTLDVLDPQLPMALTANTRGNVQVLAGEQRVSFDFARLNAEGPLLNPAINAEFIFENEIWAGRNTLNLAATASTEQLTLESLTLELPEGQLSAAGELAYAEALNWNGRLDWRNIDLTQFNSELAGVVSGGLSSRVDIVEGDLSAQVELESISGTWLEKQFTGSGEFDWQNQTLSIAGLRVQQGANRVSAAGDYSSSGSVDLAVQLNLPALGDFIPEAWAPQGSGELRGHIKLAGSLDDIIVDSELAVSDVTYSDLHLGRGQLRLQWFGRSQRAGQLELSLQQLTVAENIIADLSLSGRGNVEQHSLRLSLAGLQENQDKSAELACSGGFENGQSADPFERWIGSCTQLTLGFALAEEQQTWRLAAPIQVQAQPQQPAITLSDFCLTNNPSRLCSREAIRYTQGDLSGLTLSGEQLPTRWLQPWLPGEQVAVDGSWQFRLAAEQLLNEPRLQADVSSNSLVVRWQPQAQSPVVLNVTNINLGWRWLDQQQQLTWQLQTERSGSSQGGLTIDGNQLAGNLTINQLQLRDYARLFLPGPEDQLAGEVNATLTLTGTVRQPVLAGQVALTDGLFGTEALPVPLRDIQLTLDVDDNRAVADGSFRAAESEGEIGGQFIWRDNTWSGELAVSAEPLILRPEPDVVLHVAPDLRFELSPQRITIAGEVRVPRAEIEITELPEQAVSVSSDAVMVGDGEAAETDARLQISTNIQLVLGDAVQFEGFGLETRVTGNLTLQQSVSELLKANGILRLVEGRYQAYGQNLAIRNGDLVFVGDIDNPQLRLEAVRADTPEGVVVGLRASGAARDPEISIFSRPDMPQQAQLSYLLTGNPPGARGETDPQTAAAEAALSYALESNLGEGITRRAGSALGIDDLQVTAGSSENGTQIGLSGYVTPNLLVRYGVGVFDAINTLTLRYQLTKSVYLEATSGESSDIGILWTFESD